MNGLPVDRQTFVGADETTYRGLQYDMLSELCRRQKATHDKLTAMPASCDRKYVSWQWVKERKLLITGVVLGFGVASWGAGAILDKIFKLL
jgi:hypothetical protein